MIISDEQHKRVVEYLQGPHDAAEAHNTTAQDDLTPQLLEKVRKAVSDAPETRDDRVAHARQTLSGSGLTGAEVADKMIARIVSDSLR